VDAKKPGDEVSVAVLRGGERRTVTVTLGTRPS
jgi:S1-C subfamily serine protease